MAPTATKSLFARFGKLDPFEQEYLDAKSGTMPDDQIVEDIRQYRTINASNRKQAELEPDGSDLPLSSTRETTDVPAEPTASETPASSEIPSLDVYMKSMRPSNPDMTDRELHRHWAENYSTIDTTTLPTWDEYKKKMGPSNPDFTEQELRESWEEGYGDFGAREEGSSGARRAGDLGIGVAKGIVQLPSMAVGLADILTAGHAGKGVDAAIDQMGKVADVLGLPDWARPSQWATQLGNQYTPETKAAMRAVADEQRQAVEASKADGGGAFDEILASTMSALKGAVKHPGSLVPLVSENVPQLAIPIASTRVLLGPLQKLLSAKVAAGTMSAAEANVALGQAAVRYSSAAEGVMAAGQVSSQISDIDPRADMIHRLAAVMAGVTTSTITRGVAKIPGLGDIQAATALRSMGGAGTFTGSMPMRVAKAVLSEGVLQELPQSSLEQLWQNLGSGRPWQEGVGEQGVQGMVAGGILGGALGTAVGPSASKPLPAEQAPPPETPPGTGPEVGEILKKPDIGSAIEEAFTIVDAPLNEDLRGLASRDKELDRFIKGIGGGWEANRTDVGSAMETPPGGDGGIGDPELDTFINRIARGGTTANQADILERNRTRDAFDAPILPGADVAVAGTASPLATPSQLLQQDGLQVDETLIAPGRAFTPRAEPSRSALLEERARRLANPTPPSSPDEMVEPPFTVSDARDRPLPDQSEIQDLDRTRGPANVALLKGAAPAPPKTIEPGQGVTPRVEEPDIKAFMEAERAKLRATPADPLRHSGALEKGAAAPLPYTVTDKRASAREELARARGQRFQPEPEPAQQELQKARGTTPAKALAGETPVSPTVQDIHDLAASRGIASDNDQTFMALTEQATGKQHLDDLTTPERQRMIDVLTPKSKRTTQQATRLEAPQPTLPIQAAEKTGDADPITEPRSELPHEKNQEMLLRAEKAEADMGAGLAAPRPSLIDFLRENGGVQDQGGELSTLDAGSKKHLFQKNVIQANGMTLDEAAELAHEALLIPKRDMRDLLATIDNEVRGIGSGPGWYAELTEGPKAPIKDSKGQTAHQKIEEAIRKIIQDEGVDRGKAVEAVKTAILNDQEFSGTEWGREAARILDESGPQDDRFTPVSKRQRAQISPAEPMKQSGEPFSLTAEQPRAPKAKAPEQLGIDVPPETIGSRPMIGREVSQETAATDAPLFSKEAQTASAEQTSLPEEPTAILAKALRTAADQIEGKPAAPDAPTTESAYTSSDADPSTEEANDVQAGVEGKTVVDAADFIAKNAPNEDMRMIAGRVRDQLRALKAAGSPMTFRVSHVGEVVPRILTTTRGLSRIVHSTGAVSVFVNGADVTGLVGTSYETVLHELVHAATQAAIFHGNRKGRTSAQLEQDVSDLYDVSNAIVAHFNARVKSGVPLTPVEQSIHKGANNLEDANEVVAWTLTNREMQNYLDTIPYQGKTLWSQFVDAIRSFLGLPARAQTALSEVLRISDKLLSVPVGELKSAATATLGSKTSESRQQTADLSGNQPPPTDTASNESGSPGWFRGHLKAAKATFRPYLLGALGLNQISDVYGTAHPEVETYKTLTEEMKAEFIERTNKADPLIRQWIKLPVEMADRMSRVMEQAVRANYDPDTGIPPTHPTAATAAVTKEFKALAASPEALKIYRGVRTYYRDVLNSREKYLLERIDRSSGTQAVKAEAMLQVANAFKPLASKVYFPQTRFGDHVVIAKKMVGGKEDLEQRDVSTFAAPVDADTHAEMMKARGYTVKQTTKAAFDGDRENTTSATMSKIEEVINGLPGDGDFIGKFSTRQQLIDALRQLELQALPDMAYAKHFLHAKNVKGASRDALRAFADAALHGAHHLARLKYADQMGRALNTMQGRIEKVTSGNVTEDRQVLNELVQRHGTIMNPQVSPVAAWLGQLGFTMSLGGVVATGVTNMTQVPLITLPYLGARYGMRKSAGAITRAYQDFIDLKTLNLDSLFDAKEGLRLRAKTLQASGDAAGAKKASLESAMLAELQRRGKIDLTQTMDISGMAAQDNLSRIARQVGTKREMMMRILGFTFHAPEVMNRQVTALATYRMAVEGGATHAAAVGVAAEAVDRTQYIYTAENRPRYMSGNVMRVLTMFKQYGQNIAYMYGRAAHLAFVEQNLSPKERQIAIKQLTTMFLFQFGAAGALGLPFLGTVASLMNALMNGLGDDDEKRDWETELRKTLAENLGEWPGEVLSHGASRLTPWDMAGRLGQESLFYRPPNREREGRAGAMDQLTTLGGPVVGYGINTYLGVEDIMKGVTQLDRGHFMRGVEEMVPAVLRHGIKTLRYELEDGVRTRDGYKQMDVTGLEQLGQLFGFGASRRAEMYEGVGAIKQAEHRILLQRTQLLDDYVNAAKDGDSDGINEAIRHIEAFNARNTVGRINRETLMKSRRGKLTREAGMQDGLYVPKTRAPLREKGNFANY